jgi:uncharacterized protein involved in exopolysaccharide biosynthesis
MNYEQIKAEGKAKDEEVSLLRILIVLAKHKKLIIRLPIAAAAFAAAASFAIPNVYKSTTRLLPPQQAQSGAAALLSQLGGVASIAAGAAGLKNPGDLYVGMLRSRTIADRLIARFDLKKVYDVELQEKARRELEESTSILSGKDGLITIDVEDHDGKRSAQLANAYVEELLKLTKVLAVTEASQRRMFFERQLEQSKNNLAAAEMSLKGGLDTRGVISVDVESRAIVETVGRLRAQVSAKEIELGSMRAFVTANNPNFKRVEEELGSLRAELARLENGRDGGLDAGRDGKKQVGLENIKLLRDVKYYQMLYEMLAKQYEVARLDEAKDPSIIQVLDPAVEPERKSRPKRAVLVILGGLFGLFGTLVWAFAKEARDKAMRNPGNAARWQELTSYFLRK